MMYGALLILMGCVAGWAQSFVTVDKNIEVLGVPPVPASLAAEFAPYSQIYGLPLADWDPSKREIWLKGLSSVTWISKVKDPGASPETSSIYISRLVSMTFTFNRNTSISLTKDMDGNENFQLYLYEIDGSNSKQLSDGESRNTEPVWANAGDRIVYSSSPSGSVGVNLRVLNPFDL
jgi:hypothetical protein